MNLLEGCVFAAAPEWHFAALPRVGGTPPDALQPLNWNLGPGLHGLKSLDIRTGLLPTDLVKGSVPKAVSISFWLSHQVPFFISKVYICGHLWFVLLFIVVCIA